MVVGTGGGGGEGLGGELRRVGGGRDRDRKLSQRIM